MIHYWFAHGLTLDEIRLTMFDNDPNIPAVEGTCTIDHFKSPEFITQHDAEWVVIVLPDSLVCHDLYSTIIMRVRRGVGN